MNKLYNSDDKLNSSENKLKKHPSGLHEDYPYWLGEKTGSSEFKQYEDDEKNIEGQYTNKPLIWMVILFGLLIAGMIYIFKNIG